MQRRQEQRGGERVRHPHQADGGHEHHRQRGRSAGRAGIAAHAPHAKDQRTDRQPPHGQGQADRAHHDERGHVERYGPGRRRAGRRRRHESGEAQDEGEGQGPGEGERRREHPGQPHARGVPAAAHARQAVDGGEQHGDDEGPRDQAHRPSRQHLARYVDLVRGARRHPLSRVEGGDAAQDSPSEGGHAPDRHGALGAGAALPACRHEHRGKIARYEFPLLARREREGLPRELRERARLAWAQAALEAQRALDRVPQLERGEAVAVGPRHDHRAAQPIAGQVTEHEDGIDVAAQVPRDIGRARVPGAAAARRGEDQRLAQRPPAKDARELDQARRAGQLRGGRAVEGVTMRDDDDPALREARPGAYHGPQLLAARCRTRLEAPVAHAESPAQQLAAHARGEVVISLAAGPSRRKLVGQRRQRPEGACPRERVGRQRRRERGLRLLERERRDDEREQGREQRGPIDARVEHAGQRRRRPARSIAARFTRGPKLPGRVP
jgi:hypothetical protein